MRISSWRQLKAIHAVRSFESELVTHFQAEEMFCFRLCKEWSGGGARE